MAQISRRFMKPEVLRKIESLFIECVSRCEKPSVAADFLDDLLTRTEKVMIAKRIAIALMLLKQEDVRDISETLKVSFPTIYRVKTWLSYKGAGFRTLLTEIMKRDQETEKEHERALSDTRESPIWFGPTNWKAKRQDQWDRVRKTRAPF